MTTFVLAGFSGKEVTISSNEVKTINRNANGIVIVYSRNGYDWRQSFPVSYEGFLNIVN